MTNLSFKLIDDLKPALINADEIWIAVALMNMKGYKDIIQSIPKKCKTNFIVGIDLPTDPLVLKALLIRTMKTETTVEVVIADFFHPKVYIVKSEGCYKGFIGSANCTNGGFEKNIEMSIKVKDKKTCEELIDWFNNLDSISLTEKFIKEYEPKYEKHIESRKQDHQEIINLKKEETKKIEAEIVFQKRFINELKKFRDSIEYPKVKKNRDALVKRLKLHLDYPNFKKLDLDSFFKEKELGTIFKMTTNKPIEKNKEKFSILMQFIWNENIPIS